MDGLNRAQSFFGSIFTSSCNISNAALICAFSILLIIAFSVMYSIDPSSNSSSAAVFVFGMLFGALFGLLMGSIGLIGINPADKLRAYQAAISGK